MKRTDKKLGLFMFNQQPLIENHACLHGVYFSNFRCAFLACAPKRFDKKMTVLKGAQLKIINVSVSSYETHVDFRGLESGQWRRNTFQK